MIVKPILYIIRFLSLCCLLVAGFFAAAQDSTTTSSKHLSSPFLTKLSIGTRFYYGSFLLTKSKAEYIRDSYTSFGEVYLQQETTGSQDWQISHHFPRWGVAF